MSTKALWRVGAVLALAVTLGARTAAAAPLTADGAVKVALQKSTEMLNAEAGVIQAKASLTGAYGGLLPTFSVGAGRSDGRTNGSFGQSAVSFLPNGDPFLATGSRFNSSATTLSGSWSILSLGSWAQRSAASHGMRSAQFTRQATRNDVALATRRQFYGVVQAIKLAEVATGALKRSRDDERRVNAMFQVGSVSKSDLLKAQVATAQAELDSITADHAIIDQRIALAEQMGVIEPELGAVDTVLVATPASYDEAAILSEASRGRPDLVAAEGSLRSARASVAAARLARLPFVSATGSASFNSRQFSTVSGTDLKLGQALALQLPASGSNSSWRTTVSVSWDLFDLAGIDARIGSSRAGEIRAQAAYDALKRNLASEVHQSLLAYNEALAQNNVAQRGLESATENLKLTQEKYNVGSATILELIDAQVQLQTAQSNVVKALAAIRVAEAQVNRVRGHGE
ncbi:MAG: TolC family protein [Candidatus Eisenbacteria bacterium]|uniref:TolC family protein n=1 Tax=Eiseniibacteriota bacterium TaxID=2212470 RepID=A0A9D6L9P7_UNCEI|nr:TolC family protein [Candidatus Eisenbacteria bacterium]MBI3539575.1 TolC family protein [Candidatus Eisenbacteria bacterium]